MKTRNHHESFDWPALREKLAAETGSRYWRSLDEAAQTKAFAQAMQHEFSAQASEWHDETSRRNFLKLMGASLALAGVTGCTRQPINEIVPYVKQPEALVPGQPLFFATAREQDGFATGLLVESHEGHPTKIEGNPEHPASLGATGIWEQAAILGLYDPDRLQTILHGGKISTWNDFANAMAELLPGLRAQQGKGMRLLTETITSPTLGAQITEWQKQFPQAKWHQYQSLPRDNVLAGAQRAFEKFVETQHHFEKARVVVALDANFLAMHPNKLRYARDFADARRLTGEKPAMNRLYVIEPSPSITGAMADHRWPLAADKIEMLAEAILQNLRGQPRAENLDRDLMEWLAVVIDDLKANRGASIVIVGEHQPAAVHEAVHRINQALGNFGSTITFRESAVKNPIPQLESLVELNHAVASGEVELLIIIGGNPVYTAPADLNLADNLTRVKNVVTLSLEENETTRYAHWQIPQTHFLEAWSDTRGFDQTLSIVQPLIAPLYDSHSAHELMALLTSGMDQQALTDGYAIVRDHWQRNYSGGRIESFETFWRATVHDGICADVRPEIAPPALMPAGESSTTRVAVHDRGLEINFLPDPSLYDGRYANNGWLQELSKPITKLTWDNAVLISPRLAEEKNLRNGDVVELKLNGRSVAGPIWILPGQAEDSVAVYLGHGRSQVGRVGTGVGFNAGLLRTTTAFWSGRGLEISKTGRTYPLATTQEQHLIGGDELQKRDILFAGTWQTFQSQPDFLAGELSAVDAEPPSAGDTLYNPHEHDYAGHRWGMAIDLSACIGCNACVIACQSENNIPVVGKEQVSKGRAMQWIRIDAYFRGNFKNPEVSHLPMPCMHCENAPCELVCPVSATVHDHEGLNLMVYNRCVGTRYCSNNCPYKVRRFNFLQYADYRTPSLKPMRNPNVTVRSRGVMEKCSYCVQRISAARITSEVQNRKIADGEIKTACQQACPAKAIVFGDLSDAGSAVSKIKTSPLNYSMLGSLNTRPRTTYLAKMRNPNPRLAAVT